MKQTISLKIDVTKIDKSRLFKSEKTGNVYLDAVILLNTEKDQYDNNGMVIQSVSKEEREKGVKGEILGNVKILGNSKPPVNDPVDFDDDSSELPF